MELTTLKLRDLRGLLDERKISAPELTREYLARIRRYDPALSCFITVTEELALKQAEEAQRLIDAGDARPLTGIPLAIKDNICTEGVRTTCASKMLENFVPPYSATVMNRLNAQHAVMLGKTSMDEFAMGATTQTSAFAKTRNPFDTSRVPGGSSGGSAAAVSASLCAAALGSDTGGSIRQPAAFCGVTGFRPTYGRVPRYGVVAFASSLDQVGPIAKDAKDCAILLRAIAGVDERDATTAPELVPDFTERVGESLKGLRIGIPSEFYDAADDSVREAVLAAAKWYESKGAVIVSVSMPGLRYAVSSYYLLSSAEASSNLSRFDGIRYGYRAEGAESYDDLIRRSRTEAFGDEVKRRILLGNYALSSGYYDAYYRKALALRQEIVREYAAMFEQCDLILTPTAPTAAYGVEHGIDDPVKLYSADICTVTAAIAGLPCLSSICGYDADGMPIGMSLTGKRFDETSVVWAADAFESEFALRAPDLKEVL